MGDRSQTNEDFRDFEWEDMFCAEDPRENQIEVLEKWAEVLGAGTHDPLERGNLNELSVRVSALSGDEVERLQAYVYLLAGAD